MTSRSLFNIILKVFGLFFLREIVLIIPQFFTSILYFTKSETIEQGIFLFSMTAAIIVFNGVVTFQLLFKTNRILDILKLDQGLNQDELLFDHELTRDEFSFNLSTSLVLTIALVVTAGVILINEITNLCRVLTTYFQGTSLGADTDMSYIIVSVVKIIIALLLIGERKKIIAFVESRQSEKQQDQNE